MVKLLSGTIPFAGRWRKAKVYVGVRNDILQERRNKRLIYSALYLEERKLKMLLKQTI